MAFSGFQDFLPQFGSNLQRFIAASPGITVGSGYRDVTRQGQLWQRALAKYGSAAAARKWVAPPGHSFHNKRLAADLQFASPAARQWAHDNAARYGLSFPLGNEAWHVELLGARGGGGAGADASTFSPASPPADTGLMLAQAVAPELPGRRDINGLAERAAGRMGTGETSEAAPQLRRGGDPAPVSLDYERLADADGAKSPALVAQNPDLVAQDPAELALADLFKVKPIGRAGRIPPTRRF
jgi:hypothetical protein